MSDKKYICEYCGKEFDSPYKLGGHKIHCLLNPKVTIEKIKADMSRLREIAIKNVKEKPHREEQCIYCNKYFSIYGLKNHMKLCSCNPNKDVRKINSICLPGHKAWNKGLTAETDERVKRNGESIHKSYVGGNYKIWCEGLNKETDERISKYSQRISETVSNKIVDDKWHSFYDSEKLTYDDISFDSSWELLFYQKIKDYNIEIIRCKECFEYTFDNSIHKYFPDFYIPKFDLYVEIKGISTKKDYAKWILFPKKLNIYFSNELNEMFGIKEIRKCSKEKDNKNKQYLPEKYTNNYINII